MKLQKWNPTNDLLNLRDFWKTFFEDGERFFEPTIFNKSFKVDVYEKDGKINIEAELPGVKKEDINLELENGILTISAKMENKKEEKDKNYYYSERSYGVFTRSFDLGEVNEEDIEAKYENGILYVSVKKPEIEQKNVKKIEIK
jgi:HSP20 family protein